MENLTKHYQTLLKNPPSAPPLKVNISPKPAYVPYKTGAYMNYTPKSKYDEPMPVYKRERLQEIMELEARNEKIKKEAEQKALAALERKWRELRKGKDETSTPASEPPVSNLFFGNPEGMGGGRRSARRYSLRSRNRKRSLRNRNRNRRSKTLRRK